MRIFDFLKRKVDNNDIEWTDADHGMAGRMYGERETNEFAIIVAVSEEDAIQVLTYMSEKFGEKLTFCITSISRSTTSHLLQLRAYSKDGIQVSDVGKFLSVVDAFVDGLHSSSER